MPTFTSSTGGADSETRMVSPMPSASSVPMPSVDLIRAYSPSPRMRVRANPVRVKPGTTSITRMPLFA